MNSSEPNQSAHLESLELSKASLTLRLVLIGGIILGITAIFGSVHLPPILPVSPTLYAVLRKPHTILAYLLFFTFLAHHGAVLFHTLIIRDRLLNRMALWPIRFSKSRS